MYKLCFYRLSALVKLLRKKLITQEEFDKELQQLQNKLWFFENLELPYNTDYYENSIF